MLPGFFRIDGYFRIDRRWDDHRTRDRFDFRLLDHARVARSRTAAWRRTETGTGVLSAVALPGCPRDEVVRDLERLVIGFQILRVFREQEPALPRLGIEHGV